MFLLDASALLALLHDEPGGSSVEAYLDDAAVLSVNLEEVVGILIREGMPAAAMEQVITALVLPVVPFTERMAWLAAEARPRLPPGLGLADRCCLAAGAALDARVVTADSLWKGAAPALAVDVVLIR
ncbi:MAG: PIN domain-containing protein [Solirubrobacteraceae bacterium]